MIFSWLLLLHPTSPSRLLHFKMPADKRKRVTADDPLRMQEKPAKRRCPSRELDEDSEGDSDVEAPALEIRDSGEEEDDVSENSTGDSSSGDEEREEDGEEEDTRPPAFAPSRLANEDVSPSRIALKRKDKPQSSVPLASPSTTFASLGIAPPLITTMAGMSIRAPTEIQIACIPPLLAGKSKSYFAMNCH